MISPGRPGVAPAEVVAGGRVGCRRRRGLLSPPRAKRLNRGEAYGQLERAGPSGEQRRRGHAMGSAEVQEGLMRQRDDLAARRGAVDVPEGHADEAAADDAQRVWPRQRERIRHDPAAASVISRARGVQWGELHLRTARPDAGKQWTDEGANRDSRGLKHRAEGESRRVPCPPPLTRLLRDHLARFDGEPAQYLFYGVGGRPLATITYRRMGQGAQDRPDGA